MIKKSSNFNNEINLSEIFKGILDSKINIILIIFISIIIGILYNKQKVNSFYFSLNISPAKDSEFTDFVPLYNNLYDHILNPIKQDENRFKKKTLVDKKSINEVMLNRFFNELLDYEELKYILLNV